jgi:hypothetical protein
MPKKIRTWEDELKSLSTKKHKTTPMQKIKGMKKEHIIQSHDELLKNINEDLERLRQKEFFAPKEKRLNPAFISQPPFPYEGVPFDVIASSTMVVATPEKKLCMGVEVGSKEYEDMIDFMRADLDSKMQLSRMIDTVRKRMKEDGLDFDEEYKKWKEDRDAITKMHRI